MKIEVRRAGPQDVPGIAALVASSASKSVFLKRCGATADCVRFRITATKWLSSLI